MSETLVTAGIIAFGVGFVLYLYWFISVLLELYFSITSRRAFEADLIKAIEHCQPSLVNVLVIASTRSVKRSAVYGVLQKLLRDSLTCGSENVLAAYRTLIENYLREMDESEPFEGMPSDIRLHLERIKEELPNPRAYLDPLVGKIRELLSTSDRENRRQKYYTLGGLFVGLLGLALAIIFYLYPNSPQGERISGASSLVINSVVHALGLPREIRAPSRIIRRRHALEFVPTGGIRNGLEWMRRQPQIQSRPAWLRQI